MADTFLHGIVHEARNELRTAIESEPVLCDVDQAESRPPVGWARLHHK
jgi:hypothetical protein